jgi:hypothetical protein
VGNHSVDVTVQGAGNATIVIGDRNNATLGNVFLNGRLGSLRVLNDANATGTISATVGRNTFRSNDHSSGVFCNPGCTSADFDFPQAGVLLGSLGTTASTFDAVVDNNLFDEATNASGGVGQLTLAMTRSVWQALVTNNTFRIPGNAPWFMRADGNTTTAKVSFLNNTGVRGFFNCPDVSCAGGYFGPGLRALADVQNGGRLDLTIDGDDFAEHDAGFDPGQTFEGRALNVGAANALCLNLRNNTAPDGYSLEHRQPVHGWRFRHVHGRFAWQLPERPQCQRQHRWQQQPGDDPAVRECGRNRQRRRGRLPGAEFAVAAPHGGQAPGGIKQWIGESVRQ